MALSLHCGKVQGLTFGYRTERAARRALMQSMNDGLNALIGQDLEESAEEKTLADEMTARLKQFARGEPVDFTDIPLATDRFTEFQRCVIKACRRIAWGETCTYGELASAAGYPGAARAAGTVMSRNRFPLIVPCHRIVGAGGQLGGYSAPQGLAMKRRLLAAEQSAEPAALTTELAVF